MRAARTTTLLLPVFVAVTAVIAYAAWSGKGSTLSGKSSGFGLKNYREISGMVIRSGSTELAIRKEDVWKVQGSDADQAKVDRMLYIASLIEAVSPAPRIAEKEILEKLESGTGVEFFKGLRCVNSYQLCRYKGQLYGIRKGASMPYRLSIRGYPDIDLLKVFDPDRDAWTGKILINFSPSEIAALKVSYKGKPEKNFRIVNDKNLGILLYDHTDRLITLQADPSALAEYLHFFSNIPYETAQAGPDLLTEETRLFELEILPVRGTEFRLSGFSRKDPATLEADRFRFYGFSKSYGVIILNYNEFDPILVSAEYFLKN